MTKINLPFDDAFEHCNHDYVKLLHCHADHIVVELLDVDSVMHIKLCDFLIQAKYQSTVAVQSKVLSNLRSNFHDKYRGTRDFTLNLLEKCLNFFVIMNLKFQFVDTIKVTY